MARILYGCLQIVDAGVLAHKRQHLEGSVLPARLRYTAGSSEPPRVGADVPMQADIRSLVDRRPTYGYRRITALLRRQMGHRINHKRVYRIMKGAGMLLQRHTGRPARVHTGKVVTLHRNTRWCSDAFGIQCWNGEQLQVAFSMDCCDREVISYVTSTRGIDGELVRDLMTESVDKRFGAVGPRTRRLQWLSDNGPGYTALGFNPQVHQPALVGGVRKAV